MLIELTVSEYLEQLASGVPAPGGGAAAGLAGAQGAALLSMLCNLTIGRKKYADVEAAMQGLLAQSEALRGRLTALIDRDATAYDEVMAAYKLPRQTDAEAGARNSAIQDALKHATEVPLETLAACVEVLELGPAVLQHGNPNAASDGGAGVLTAHAGMITAALNVRINLEAIQDATFVRDIEAEMSALLARGEAARQQAWAIASERLGM